MSFLKTLKSRSRIITYLFDFLWSNKLWWMIPMVLFLMVFFLIIILGQGTPLGPFIYTLF